MGQRSHGHEQQKQKDIFLYRRHFIQISGQR
jgi:hypothetical protein